MMKKYLFLVVTMVLAGCFIALGLLTEDDTKIVYVPQVGKLETAEPTQKASKKIKIRPTQLVYYTDDSKYFHIKKDCGNVERFEGHPCGYALELGMEPCLFCMVNYEITEK